jgi:hypothetical protein
MPLSIYDPVHVYMLDSALVIGQQFTVEILSMFLRKFRSLVWAAMPDCVCRIAFAAYDSPYLDHVGWNFYGFLSRAYRYGQPTWI